MLKKLAVLLIVVMLVLAASFPALAAPGLGRRPESPGNAPEIPGVVPESPGNAPERDPIIKEIKEVEKEGKIPGPPEFVMEMKRQRLALFDSNRITVRGRPFQSELPPVIKDNRILIPVRAVMNALQAEVVWDPDARTVTITREITRDNVQIVVKIVIDLDDKTYSVYEDADMDGIDGFLSVTDKTDVPMDVPPQILSRRTFVPLRLIAEALGEKVTSASGNVTIGEPDND